MSIKPERKIVGVDLSEDARLQLYVGLSDGSGLYIDGPWHATDPEGAGKFRAFAKDLIAMVQVRKTLTL